MKISTKGRYVLRMLIDLAEHQGDGYIPLKEIAQRQGVSKKYLEQIVPMLNKSDILRTNRGFQGGYRLAKAPDKYTVGDILRLTEGSLAPVACLESGVVECDRSEHCATLSLWQGLYKVINEYLDSVTLQDLIDSDMENAADDYGFEFSIANGIDPYSMYNSLNKLLELSAEAPKSSKFRQLFSSHPETQKRVERMKEKADEYTKNQQ